MAGPGEFSQMGLWPELMPTVNSTACSCNAWFCGSFWATVGRSADTGLGEEVAVLVGDVAGEDSEMSSSQCGMAARTAPWAMVHGCR